MANFLQNDKGINDYKINNNKYNGRVDIFNQKPVQKYNMINQNSSGNRRYRQEAIKSIHTESPLSRVYFSKENIDLIQNSIRHTVWKRTNKKHIIGRQSDLQLKINTL